MKELLNKNVFLVKEHVGIFKAANNYDIYDPQSGQIILECREDNLGFFTKMLRFTDYKTLTPFEVKINTPDGKTLLTIKRGVSFFLSTVSVYDENNKMIGGFKQKFFSIGGKFDVLNSSDQVLCGLKGNWVGWEFNFELNNRKFASVSKKWAGIGKELFTSADNYVLEISEEVPADSVLRKLIVAAVMCIDMVLKEN